MSVPNHILRDCGRGVCVHKCLVNSYRVGDYVYSFHCKKVQRWIGGVEEPDTQGLFTKKKTWHDKRPQKPGALAAIKRFLCSHRKSCVAVSDRRTGGGFLADVNRYYTDLQCQRCDAVFTTYEDSEF